MSRKPIKKHPSASIQKNGSEAMDRIAAAAERLAGMLFERDREVMDREQKLREMALEIIQKVVEKRAGGDDFINVLQGFVKEASSSLEKMIDLKKLEAMAPGFSGKGGVTASRKA